MAYLRNLQTNEKLYLLTHHTFGRRDGAVDTCILQPEISKIHAVIEWSGEQWEIRDLGRNGTWLDQKKLPTAQNSALKIGQIINFSNQKQNDWQVENLDKPTNLLLGLNDYSTTEAFNHYHLLPDNTEPLAALFLCSNRGQWVLETRSGSTDSQNENNERIIVNSDTIEVGRHQWKLFLNAEQQQTVDLLDNQANAENCEFQFEVSLDEEHTQLSLQYQNDTVKLGERSHHYLLLHLARLKFEHAEQGLDHKNQGWINNEQLAKELGIDISHINIQIFRARKQISEAYPNMLGLTDLLQRRRGEVRFNCPQAKVVKGDQLDKLSA